jgi:hypothetical protein
MPSIYLQLHVDRARIKEGDFKGQEGEVYGYQSFKNLYMIKIWHEGNPVGHYDHRWIPAAWLEKVTKK